MKIKKVIILLLVLFIPFFCYAEECNKNDIKIETIELSDIRGNAEELVSPNNNNNKINLNTKMNVIGDNITYKVVVKNTSNSDYIFDKNSLTKDYLSYDITYEDDSNIIKPNEEKVIYLRLSYDNKPEVENLVNGVLKGNEQISFDLTKEPEFINPETGNKILLSLIYLLIPVIISFYLIKKRKPAFIVLLALTIIPYIVNASCTCITTLDINLALEIDRKEAIFLPGTEVNIKMKQLAGDDTSTATNGYYFQDRNITAIKKGESEPIDSNKEEKNIVSTPESLYPIYMWYEDNTIYWWSEDGTPAINENASYMFVYLSALKDIQGLSSFDSSSATTLVYFLSWSGLLNIDPLANWNTSKVTKMIGMLSNNMSIVDVSGLKDWDVTNVESMYSLFSCCYELEEIDLRNWKTSSLTMMKWMFASLYYSADYSLVSKLKRIYISESFDTSQVTNMEGLFYNDRYIEDYSFLKQFDTTNVTSMNGMFQSNRNFNKIDYIKNWDVSNVTDYTLMFASCSSLTRLDGLENWNVSLANNMYRMFYSATNLESVNAINDWDITNVTDFSYMFYNVPVHPEFSKVSGSWNSKGTFTPNP